MSTQRPTMADIAERLGVSVSAVSIALSERKGVGDDLRERVRTTADELGYTHHAAAVALRTGRTGTLVLMVSDHHDPLWLDIIKGFDEECARLGLNSLVFSTPQGATHEETLATVRRRGADGVALLPHGALAPLRAWSQENDVPLVLLGSYDGASPGIHTVSLDIAQAARQVIGHLTELGHRRVWLLAGPHAASEESGISRVFLEVAREHGLEASVLSAPVDHDGIRAVMTEALDAPRERRATAVVATTDWAAYAVCATARDVGLVVPDDLSVLGVTDLPSSRLFTPSLTTIRLDKQAMGREAARWLSHAALAPAGTPGERHVIGCELIARDSTGTAPADGR